MCSIRKLFELCQKYRRLEVVKLPVTTFGKPAYFAYSSVHGTTMKWHWLVDSCKSLRMKDIKASQSCSDWNHGMSTLQLHQPHRMIKSKSNLAYKDINRVFDGNWVKRSSYQISHRKENFIRFYQQPWINARNMLPV